VGEGGAFQGSKGGNDNLEGYHNLKPGQEVEGKKRLGRDWRVGFMEKEESHSY